VTANGKPPEPLRTLLVALDLTAISDRLLARIALLPLAADARVTLLHVVSASLPPRELRGVERDARRALAAERKRLASALPRGASVEAAVAVGAAASEIARRARANGAELVVMGRGGARALRDVFLGSTAERVVRRTLLPVLVVRLAARARYRRPTVALAADRAAHDAVALLLRLVPPPRPPVTVVHAVDIPYRGLVYPSLSARHATELTRDLEARAAGRVARLLAASLAAEGVRADDAPGWRTRVRCGSPRQEIEKAVKMADGDLLVLGTHGHRGVAQLFLGSVAGDVLRSVSCDVLVVPPRATA
jgi:nucleotide-binding universal stress UspA family protein